jgi:hypothetical protein
MAITGGSFLAIQPIAFRSRIVSVGDLLTSALGPQSTVVGPESLSTAAADRSVSVGYQCTVRGPDNVLVGQSCFTTGLAEMCVLLGNSVVVLGQTGNAVQIGRNLLHTGSSTASYVELVSIGFEQTVLIDYVDTVVLGHTNSLVGSAGGSDNVLIGHGNQCTSLPTPQSKNIAVGSTNIIRGSTTVSVGHDNTTGLASTLTYVVGGSISIDNSSAQIVAFGCSLTVGAPSGTPFTNAILIGCNNSTSSGGGGDTVIMVGNNLNHTGAGNVSRNLLLGDDNNSTNCTNTGSIGHNHSLVNSVEVHVYGGTIVVGNGSSTTICAGSAITTGTTTSLNVLLGTTITVGHNAFKCVVVGNNIVLPDNSVAVVVLGDGAYAANASVAIGQQARVGFGGVGGNGCVAIGALSFVGTSTNNSAAIANSTVGNSAGGSLATVNSNIGDNSPSCAALANSSVATGSTVCFAATSSTVGTGCAECFAAVASTIDNGVLRAIAINGTATGTHSIALAGGVAGANEMVVGGSLLANSFRTFQVRGFNGVTLNTIRAIDTPSAGETGLSVIYNNGVAVTNKTLKAAASPPVGALLLYVDP